MSLWTLQSCATLCNTGELVRGNACATCPAGTTNTAGDNASGGNTRCDATLCAADEFVSANACASCPPGTTNAAGDNASRPDTTCNATLCTANQHVLANACTACPAGTTHTGGDNASGADTLCDATLCAANERVVANACTACKGGRVNAGGDDASGCETQCDNPHPRTINGLVQRFLDAFWYTAVGPASENHRIKVWIQRPPTQPVPKGLVKSLKDMLHEKKCHRLLDIGENVTQASAQEFQEGARNQGFTRLLIINISVKRNHVYLVGKHFDLQKSLWERIRNPADATASYSANARIDAELRASLRGAAIRKSQPQFRLHPLAIQSDVPFLSGAVGDIDGDGFQEIILVSHRDVQVFRWLAPAGEPTAVATFSLNKLPKRASRSRDRFAHVLAADVTGDRSDEIAFWTSDLQHGLVLKWKEGRLVALKLPSETFPCGYNFAGRSRTARLCGPPLMTEPRLDGKPGMQILQGDVPLYGWNFLKPRFSTWTTDGGKKYHPRESIHWNLFGGSHVYADGRRRVFTATVGQNNDVIIRTTGHEWTLESGNGIAGAVADLDDDGEAELIRTTNAAPGRSDAIVIHRLPMNTTVPPEIWRTHITKRSVVSLAPGDVNNDGFMDVLTLLGGLPYRLVETRM